MKNKTNLNMWIDMLMFILMLPIAGIGFLMKYVLVSGAERNQEYGQEVDLLYCGLDRHQWGSLHLYLSFFLLFLLLLHILFHWKMIGHWFKVKVRSHLVRIALGGAFLLIGILFGIMPFFVKPEIILGTKHHAHSPHQHQIIFNDTLSVTQQNVRLSTDNTSLFNQASKSVQESTLSNESDHHTHHQFSEINGQMTLHQLCQRYALSEQAFCNYWGIPSGQVQQRLGRLRKQYGFSLEDLRIYISNTSAH